MVDRIVCDSDMRLIRLQFLVKKKKIVDNRLLLETLTGSHLSIPMCQALSLVVREGKMNQTRILSLQSYLPAFRKKSCI